LVGTLARPISDEEKRQALLRVLESRALGRSEQLRKLFRYVCEAEIEGRAHELGEYLLGVAVLGRPAGYSPSEDSCVRSRAYELRNRLRTYYESEAPDDPIRIEIDKGAYCPRFQHAARPVAEGGIHDELPLPSPELRALWGPLLMSEAPLLIAFDVRLFFFAPSASLVVRDSQANDLAAVARSEPLLDFQRRMGAAELLETRDYADFGSVHAAFLLGRLLSRARRDIALKHSAALDWQDVYNSNLVFVGNDKLSPIIRTFLEGRDFLADEFGVIRNVRPLEGEAPEYRGASTHGEGEKYALITRVRGPQAGRYLLLLTAAAAELMWALGESVTNTAHVAEILSQLRMPAGQYNEEFQIVIRATFQSNVPVQIRYVTHHVLPSA
jgi:hypothetical protein